MALRPKFVVIAALMVTLLSGCVAPAPTTFTPPSMTGQDIKKSEIINVGYDRTWDGLIKYAASTFFAIKQFERASGLMTLSFGSDEPSRFVDCGAITVPARNYSGSSIGWFQLFGPVQLDGAINLLVAKVSDTSTEVTVNSRYILTFADRDGRRYVWSFDHGGSSTQAFGPGYVTCRSTSIAERDILNGIRAIVGRS